MGVWYCFTRELRARTWIERSSTMGGVSVALQILVLWGREGKERSFPCLAPAPRDDFSFLQYYLLSYKLL